MAGRQLPWIVALVALVGLATCASSMGAQAQDAAVLHEEVLRLHRQGNYAEALPPSEKYVALARRQYGEEHPEFAAAIASLAHTYQNLGRYSDAEPLFLRSLAIVEKALNPEHPDIFWPLTNLAALYQAGGRHADAEPLYRRALTITEKSLGFHHPLVATALDNLASFLVFADRRLAEAEPLYRRALLIREKSLGSEDPMVSATLGRLASLLQQDHRYTEAELLYRRALAITEKSLGLYHPDVAVALDGLASFLSWTDRSVAAEPLYRRSLAIREKSFGPEHPTLTISLTNLANLLSMIDRKPEAETLMRRALVIQEKTHGGHHPSIVVHLTSLAGLLTYTDRHTEAEAIYRRALTITETNFGPEHTEVASTLGSLAFLLVMTNRFTEAEPLYRRALAIQQKHLGTEHTFVAGTLWHLAGLLLLTNRFAEAESLYRRALAIQEKSFGPEHSFVSYTLGHLAYLLHYTGRFTEAELLSRRALAIAEKAFGPDHSSVAESIANLANLLLNTNRFTEAEPLYRRALAIQEKAHGPEHTIVATSLTRLGDALRESGRFTEAEPLYRRALAILETRLGSENFQVAAVLGSLARLQHSTGRYNEAESVYLRALQITEKRLGPDHWTVAALLNGLAALHGERANWKVALALHARAKPILTRRRDAVDSERSGLGKAMLAHHSRALRWHARAAYRANHEGVEEHAEGFQLAQWALQTEAAEALSQMSLRFAKGDDPLAAVVRERQDLMARRRSDDKRLLAALGRANVSASENIRLSIARLDADLDAVDRRLAAEFREYAELADAKPLTISSTQALLKDDEALVVLLDVPQLDNLVGESLLWVVTKKEARWTSSELGTDALTERVAALRCGLDPSLWNEGESRRKCVEMLKAYPTQITIREQVFDVLPFDLERAHALYTALLGPVEDLIKDKHLLVVPSGPLTSLPFHVLVTKLTKTRNPGSLPGYREAAWLGTRQPITVLPSVASLRSLRQFHNPSRASKLYLGIGNPQLDGPQDDPRWGEHYKKQAQAARSKQRCPSKWEQRITQAGGRSLSGFAKLFRGGQVDIEEVRAWTPLPETADELCEVGRRLGVRESEIWLGPRATEGSLKDLSESGSLSDYQVVHFATHGALTGQVQGTTEPGLILTPPAKGTSDAKALERDDGFLTASEIATLKLDADWVVLSACNTGGASGDTAEQLSGIARAFFYAGARALLVSHWEVDSDAAVKLTTRAFAEMKSNPRIGRAEAFRISMRELIEKGKPIEAHPSQWAPFVVVGEGAAR